MPKVRAQIPWRYRLILYSGLLLSWCTGVSLYALQQWIRVESPFGPEFHPAQSTVRQVHGAAAFAMMIIYGYLLASHVPASWKQRRQRIAGLSLLGFQFILIATGYIIYYAADEQLLEVIKLTHFIVGLTFPLMLIIHIIGAMVTKPKKKKSKK